MSSRKHLFLALGGFSWGETAFGAQIARDLHQRGDAIVFIANAGCRRLLIDTTFPVEFVASDEELQRAVQLALDPSSDLSSMVLADECMTTTVLRAASIDPMSLLESPAPLIAIDTWDHATTGDTIDVGFGRTRPVSAPIAGALRIVPVPMASPAGRGTRCRALPPGSLVADVDRDRLRASLGVHRNQRAVLVCTAPWQSEDRESDRAVPELLSAYLSELGPDVHVVHVGQVRSALARHLDERYHWLPSLTPSQFDLLLGSVDLLLSLNVSANTIGKAVASHLPTVVIQNTVEAAARGEAGAERGVPFFRVWPLGFVEYLAPLFASNPYREAFITCELFDRQHVVDACRSLLFEPASREALRRRQEAYATRLQSLPTAAEAITSFLQGPARDRGSDQPVGKPIAE